MATSVLENYHYDAQLRKYILQFAAIFAGIQVEVGKRGNVEPHLIHVPVKNASSDRVVAHIKSENTQNKPIRLPLISFQLGNVDQAPELRKGVGLQRRTSHMPTGGVFPDDITVVEQRQPVPYKAIFELAIWASNQDQHYQIMEQILTLFDPILQIQISDDIFDWTKLTSVEMVDIRFDETVPSGGDRRLIQTRIGFAVPIYLSIPAKVHNRYVKDIYLRIGAVGTDVQSSYDIIADLDSQGETYEKVFSLDDVDITQ
jgi:hypothetical protein